MTGFLHQYWFKDHLYTDLFVVCGEDSRCLVKNDSPLTAFKGTLRLSALDVTNSASIAINSTAVSLTKGAGAATWLCAGGGSPYDRCDSWAATLERSNAVSTTPHNNNDNIRSIHVVRRKQRQVLAQTWRRGLSMSCLNLVRSRYQPTQC